VAATDMDARIREYDAEADRLATLLDARVTLIARDGRVLGDSAEAPGAVARRAARAPRPAAPPPPPTPPRRGRADGKPQRPPRSGRGARSGPRQIPAAQRHGQHRHAVRGAARRAFDGGVRAGGADAVRHPPAASERAHGDADGP